MVLDQLSKSMSLAYVVVCILTLVLAASLWLRLLSYCVARACTLVFQRLSINGHLCLDISGNMPQFCHLYGVLCPML